MLLSTTTLFSQRSMSPEDLFKFSRISALTKVDNKHICYIQTIYSIADNKGYSSLILQNTETQETRELVSKQYHPSQPMLTPDGTKIGFVSAKDGEAQLWEISWKDGKTPKKISNIKGGITLFRYAPRGAKVILGRTVKLDITAKDIYPAYPKSTARIADGLMFRHWNAWHDYTYNHLFLYSYNNDSISSSGIDLLAGEQFHAPTMPFGGVEELCFSSDGLKVYYTCKKKFGTQAANSTNTDIYEYDLTTTKTKNLSEDNKGYDKNPALSPDGKQIAWMSMQKDGYEADKNRLFVLSLGGKNATSTDITTKFEFSVDEYTWSNDSKEIYFTAAIAGTHQIFSVNVQSKDIKTISKGNHDYTAILDYGSTLITTKMSISQPLGIFKLDKATETEQQLDVENKALLAELKMGKVEKRMVETSDKKQLLSWVIYPPDFDPNKKYPTLLYCQGGPQSPVSQFFSYRWNFQLMAAQGYIVIAPNRRGLQGFGSEWNDQIRHDYGGQAMQDLLSAIDDIATEPYVNKEKLGAVGASFGGYSVYWLAGNHNKRFKAFISHCGMFNMESWYGSTEEMFFANEDNGPYWLPENKENYSKHSPHKYVNNWDTPILVIHNELDFRVPLAEGLQAFNAAQQKGIPSKFLYFEDEGHWINKPQNAMIWQHTFFDWLEIWLKKDIKK